MAKNEKNTKLVLKKLKLIVTVVDRPKAEFYMDVIGGFEVNCQMLMSGQGTATSDLVDRLGLNVHKAVIVSVIREDMTDTIMKCLEEKFATIRNGKGIAFAVPMPGRISWQFTSNWLITSR